jgi:hypothetical protein
VPLLALLHCLPTAPRTERRGAAPLGYNCGLPARRAGLRRLRCAAAPPTPRALPMDAERLNQTQSLIDDLRARLGELRRYL